jgi:hypothetical protein
MPYYAIILYCASCPYRFFRTMALRHLVVINAAYEPVGIVTRRDLTYSQLFDKSTQKVPSLMNYLHLL